MANEEHPPEYQKISLKDLGYIVADDDNDSREMLSRVVFEGRFKTENIRGSVGSVEELMQSIKDTVEAGKSLELILLDKEFYAGGELVENAALEFLKQFESYKQGLQGEERDRADRIRTILFSGSIWKGDREEMSAVSPSVIGFIEKPARTMHSRIAAMLADAGVIEDDESNTFIAEGRNLNAQS